MRYQNNSILISVEIKIILLMIDIYKRIQNYLKKKMKMFRIIEKTCGSN